MRNYDPPQTTLANALNVALSEPNQPNGRQAKPDKPLRIATIAQLLTHQFPKREPVLAPAFCLGSINMVFSRRGIGKTHTALGIAYAGASGSSFWTWTATRPFKTLYIDGEMPGGSLANPVG